MNVNSCPKCGSTEWERGKIFESGKLTDIRFKADAASVFSFKKELAVLACVKCGYLEFYLSDFDTRSGT